jgi:hypothetical protein
MSKNKFSDPITDQEMAFALLVLSGTMTDQRAAKAVGLNPHNAASLKCKPCVRAYMLEHRARVQQPSVEKEAEEIRRLNPSREQVLVRLWEIANMTSEMTRGSITGQVKALSMIVAIEGLIPERIRDKRAGSVQNKPVPPPTFAEIDPAAQRKQQETTTNPQEEDRPDDPPAQPARFSAADAPDSVPDFVPVPGDHAFPDIAFSFSEA